MNKEDYMLLVAFCLLFLCLISVFDPIFSVGHVFREYLYVPFLVASLIMAVWLKEPAFFLPYVFGAMIYDLIRQDVFWTVQVPLFTIIVCIKYWKEKEGVLKDEKG